MKRRARVLIVAWLSSACASERSEADARPPSKADESEPAEPEPGPQAKGERWRTTVEDAKAAGLPPVAFSFDLTGSGMSGGRVGNGDYVMLSGPPGGPLTLRIAPATVGADPATLVQHGSATVTPEEVELLGAKQRAVAWITGEGMTRISWCGIVVAPPGAAEGGAALLVELGVGYFGEAITCKTTVEHIVLGPIMKSFALE